MIDLWNTIVAEMGERAEGPLSMRLYLQPTVAIVLAVRDGLRDAREGRPAYFWSLVTDPQHRAYMLRDGWKSISTVFLLVVVLDIVFLLLTDHAFLPRQSLFLALILAVIPYLILRSAVMRIAVLMRRRT